MNEAATVLVVDDTPQNVKLLTDLLMLNGYRVETAQSGEEALAKIAASVPDIVLLDVMMPGLSGYDVCRMFRASRRQASGPTHSSLAVVACSIGSASSSGDPRWSRSVTSW